MAKDVSSNLADTRELLYYIHSLGGIATREEIGSGAADALVREGLLELAWIGSYAVTEAGERLILGISR